jgi:hypothetical protein
VTLYVAAQVVKVVFGFSSQPVLSLTGRCKFSSTFLCELGEINLTDHSLLLHKKK